MTWEIASTVASILNAIFKKCHEKKKKEDDIKANENTLKKTIQSNWEMQYMQRRADLERTKPPVLKFNYTDTDSYVKAFFDLLNDEYNSFLKKDISDNAWSQMKKYAKDQVNLSKKLFQIEWSVMGVNYSQDFTSMINNEILSD